MKYKYDIGLISPPDRKKLVAEIFFENQELVEIEQEKDKPEIIIYPKKSDEPWVLDYEDFLEALQTAYKRLTDR